MMMSSWIVRSWPDFTFVKPLFLLSSSFFVIPIRLCNYDDWRIPTVEELMEIVTFCGGTPVRINDDHAREIRYRNKANGDYQSCHKEKGFFSDYYWSSGTSVCGSMVRHGFPLFDFPTGYFGNTDLGAYVRCVRTGQ